jgi:hypothetical protein
MDNPFIYLIIHLVCAFLTVGIIVADFQGNFPAIAQESYRSNLSFGVLLGLVGGPFALVVAFFFSGFMEHGWYIRRKK